MIAEETWEDGEKYNILIFTHPSTIPLSLYIIISSQLTTPIFVRMLRSIKNNGTSDSPGAWRR